MHGERLLSFVNGCNPIDIVLYSFAKKHVKKHEK